jgi:SNF family Na+-dependent transporter
MSIGIGIFLIVVGAILSFALQSTLVSWIDIHLVGEILMGAGLIVFVISVIFLMRRQKSVTTVRSGVDASGQRIDQQEHVSNTTLQP